MSHPPFVNTLIEALSANLNEAGLDSEIQVESVEGTRMYRFFVISDQFGKLNYSERQNLVWRIVDKALPQSDAIKISMIMTLTGEEASGES